MPGLGRVGEEGKHAWKKTRTHACASGRVCACGHAHLHTCPHIHKHAPLPALKASLFNSQQSLFNSHVVVSSLITLDNNLIKKRCPGIHSFSLATYPHLPLSSSWPPLKRTPFLPSLSISLALCRPPPLSVTHAE